MDEIRGEENTAEMRGSYAALAAAIIQASPETK